MGTSYKAGSCTCDQFGENIFRIIYHSLYTHSVLRFVIFHCRSGKASIFGSLMMCRGDTINSSFGDLINYWDTFNRPTETDGAYVVLCGGFFLFLGVMDFMSCLQDYCSVSSNWTTTELDYFWYYCWIWCSLGFAGSCTLWLHSLDRVFVSSTYTCGIRTANGVLWLDSTFNGRISILNPS